MEKLKHMKECLIACVQSQIAGNLEAVDAKELGEAIDMIKDLEEAIYYATITKAMEEKPLQHHNEQHQQYMPMMDDKQNYKPNYNRNMNYSDPMYNRGSSNGGNGRSYMHDVDGAMGMGQNYERDAREGVSPMYRKMYMEGKEMQHDKTKQMKDLENYVQELSNDIVEMISDASPEERQMLHQKICMLATKIK